MRRTLRGLLLAVHIIASVGWLVLLALALAGILVMTPLPWWATPVMATSAVLALLTGALLAAVSGWGLMRYWWMLGKLAGGLVIAAVGATVAFGVLPDAWLLPLRYAGVVVLTALVVASVLKPGGRRRGRGVQVTYAEPPGRHRQD